MRFYIALTVVLTIIVIYSIVSIRATMRGHWVCTEDMTCWQVTGPSK